MVGGLVDRPGRPMDRLGRPVDGLGGRWLQVVVSAGLGWGSRTVGAGHVRVSVSDWRSGQDPRGDRHAPRIVMPKLCALGVQ